MNKELLGAVGVLERGKNISRGTLIEATENSSLTAYKNHFGKADNVKVAVNPDACNFAVYAEKAVVENVENDCLEMSLADAKVLSPKHKVGDTVQTPLDSRKFGRITTQNTKNVVLQKIREEKRKALYNECHMRRKDVMTGIVQYYLERSVSINLGRMGVTLGEGEQVEGETFRPTEHVKVYVIKVEDTPRSPRVSVSRTYLDLVKRLFEPRVTEVRDGTVEVEAITREAGSRTKIAVKSNSVNVDPVSVCVDLNGSGVNPIVSKLKGEKVDIINWDDNPARLIESALNPTKVICVVADKEEREAQVIVPDYQLSLATGKEGQNAKLTAKLTGFKISIKSRIQVKEMRFLEQMELQYGGTPSETYEKETKEMESYRGYGGNYREDGSKR